MSRKGHKVRSAGQLMKASFRELGRNDPLRMAGATAFFTSFALPPILIILIQVLSLFLDPDKVSRQLFSELEGVIGARGTEGVVQTLRGVRRLSGKGWWTAAGFLFLIFVATTLFKVIKSSLNQLWKVRVFGRRKLWVRLRTRVQSFLVILVAGILFIIGVSVESLQALLGGYLAQLSPLLAFYINSLLSQLISLLVVTLWFAIVFRYLPDARPDWTVVLVGGLFTSLLFNIGKYLLRYLLLSSNLQQIYGASGSAVLLLLFVFYSSLILYFGAAFTKVWAEHSGQPIHPLRHAMSYQVKEVEE